LLPTTGQIDTTDIRGHGARTGLVGSPARHFVARTEWHSTQARGMDHATGATVTHTRYSSPTEAKFSGHSMEYDPETTRFSERGFEQDSIHINPKVATATTAPAERGGRTTWRGSTQKQAVRTQAPSISICRECDMDAGCAGYLNYDEYAPTTRAVTKQVSKWDPEALSDPELLARTSW